MNGRILFLLPLPFLLVACGPPSFEHALCDAKDAPLDPGLQGEWVRTPRNQEDGADRFVRLKFTKGEGNQYVLRWMERDQWEEKGLIVFTALVGCDRYLNIQSEQDDQKQVRYLIGKYSLSLDGTLMLALLQERPVAEAIDAGQLKGTVKRNKNHEIEDVLVSDTAENVRAFLEKTSPEKLLGDLLVFRRAPGPGPAKDERF